ncbi:MAG: MarR family transcriptional regulator [Paludibacter sp.]|nr:MarR family transcriptional regulator [Paludibacter sp.]
MKTKNILIELIERLNDYELEAQQTGTTVNMTDFLGYLNSRYVHESVTSRELGGDFKNYEPEEGNGQNTDISILIVLLFRYAKGYIKKALKDSMIKTADEFSFLITLLTFDSLSKTELIQKQVMEKTSGTEIINRLLKLGLLEQYQDEVDKRSIRVKISPSGRVELFKILPQMRTVSQIVAGNLTVNEKNMLAYMLRKLEHFHNDIYLNKKDNNLEELI